MTSRKGKDGTEEGQTGGTQIDLGDDLLEATALSRTSVLQPESPIPEITKALRSPGQPSDGSRQLSPEEIHDRVQSARILYNEGLIEEAKKRLRQVLIDDPPNAFATQLLGDIHKLELKQIFGGSQARRNVYAPTEEPEEDLSVIDADEILFRLDQDLNLGFFESDGAESPIAQLAIFGEGDHSKPGKEMEAFALRVERGLRHSTLKDRMDVGIGFLEMGLFDLAARQFRHVHRRARPQLELLVSSAALLAYALILSGHPFDAEMVLQPVVKDLEVSIVDKLELFYLMGRTQEMLGKHEGAAEWYLQVREHDPFYRDIEERLRRIGG